MALSRLAVAACSAALLSGLALPAQAQSAPAAPASSFSWNVLPTGSTDQFRGLAAVSAKVAWVSGESGTVLRTTNGGTNWRDVSPPAAAGFALRDIEAWDGQHAVTMSIGKGKHSRIWATHDGGQTWKQVFMNRNGSAFYDCMAFSKDGLGLAMSDPVNGKFRLARSTDYGDSWKLYVPHEMPPAMSGEFAFAASGTCIINGPARQFWIGSGGDHPRVFRSIDGGLSWTVANTPIRPGPSAGIYSLAVHGPANLVAVGGDYADPTKRDAAAGMSGDGGQNWMLSTRQVFGYRSGVAYNTAKIVIAVGPTGSDVSRDGGMTWTNFDSDWYDGVQCTTDGTCWASGTNGRVAVLQH